MSNKIIIAMLNKERIKSKCQMEKLNEEIDNLLTE